MKNRIHFLLISFSIVYLSCEIYNDSTNYKLSVISDENIYSKLDSVEILFTSTNLSDENIYYLVPSEFTTLEYNDNSNWVPKLPYWFIINPVEPKVVTCKPNNSIFIPSINSSDTLFDKTGEYRINVAVYKDKDLNEILEIDDRTSNIFNIIN